MYGEKVAIIICQLIMWKFMVHLPSHRETMNCSPKYHHHHQPNESCYTCRILVCKTDDRVKTRGICSKDWVGLPKFTFTFVLLEEGFPSITLIPPASSCLNSYLVIERNQSIPHFIAHAG